MGPAGFLATGGRDNAVNLYNYETGSLVTCLGPHSSTVSALALGSEFLLVGCGSGHLKLWDISLAFDSQTDADSAPMNSSSFQKRQSSISCVTFHPFFEFFAASSSDNISIFDTRHKFPIQNIYCSGGNVETVSFSPDGQLLASSTREKCCLFDVSNGGCVWSFDFSGADSPGPKSLVFDPLDLFMYISDGSNVTQIDLEKWSIRNLRIPGTLFLTDQLALVFEKSSGIFRRLDGSTYANIDPMGGDGNVYATDSPANSNIVHVKTMDTVLYLETYSLEHLSLQHQDKKKNVEHVSDSFESLDLKHKPPAKANNFSSFEDERRHVNTIAMNAKPAPSEKRTFANQVEPILKPGNLASTLEDHLRQLRELRSIYETTTSIGGALDYLKRQRNPKLVADIMPALESTRFISLENLESIVECLEIYLSCDALKSCHYMDGYVQTFRDLLTHGVADNDVSHSDRRNKCINTIEAMKIYRSSLDSLPLNMGRKRDILHTKRELDDLCALV